MGLMGDYSDPGFSFYVGIFNAIMNIEQTFILYIIFSLSLFLFREISTFKQTIPAVIMSILMNKIALHASKIKIYRLL